MLKKRLSGLFAFSLLTLSFFTTAYASPGLVEKDSLLTAAMIVDPEGYPMNQEKIIQKATAHLREIGDFETIVDHLNVEAFFLVHEHFCGGTEPVWLLYFYQGKELVQKMLLGYGGSYIDTVNAGEDFCNTTRYNEGLDVNFFDFDFWNMSIEEKAVFSEKWKPVVDQYANEQLIDESDPDFLLFMATRAVYGLPSRGDMQQNEAVMLAMQAIASLGANDKTLNRRRVECFFDITNKEQPLWKFVIFQADMDDREARVLDENFCRFRVVIDSRARTVVDVIQITNDMDFSSFRF